jgi:hypothetical protein
MSWPLLRRLDDAWCALCTGHSRRDLDRVRMRRFRVLGDRLVARHLAEAVRPAPAGFEELLSLFAERHREAASTVQDLTNRVVVGRERIAEGALLQQFEIERSSLYSRRRDESLHREDLDVSAERQHRGLEALPVAAPELYGKLYEGLAKNVLCDFFLERARLAIWNGHRHLRRFDAGLRNCQRRTRGVADV